MEGTFRWSPALSPETQILQIDKIIICSFCVSAQTRFLHSLESVTIEVGAKDIDSVNAQL